MEITIKPNMSWEERVDAQIMLEKDFDNRVGHWVVPHRLRTLFKTICMWLDVSKADLPDVVLYDVDTQAVSHFSNLYSPMKTRDPYIYRVTGSLSKHGTRIFIERKRIDLVCTETALADVSHYACVVDLEAADRGYILDNYDITVDRDNITLDGEIRYYAYKEFYTPKAVTLTEMLWVSVQDTF